MKGQLVQIQDEPFFICQYTGAPCTQRYFIPTGPTKRGKYGTFATLPIALRAIIGNPEFDFGKTKILLEQWYQQPDIPVQPALDKSRVPLSSDELELYCMELEMGDGWLRVPKAQTAASTNKPDVERPKRKKLNQ